MAKINQIEVNGTTYDIQDSNAMEKIASPTNGDILTVDSNGQPIDSGVTLSSKQNTVLSGTIEPTNDMGVDGDIYILYTV